MRRTHKDDFLGSKATNKFPLIPHFCLMNRDLVALVHLSSLGGAVGEMLRVSQSPSAVFQAVFCGRLQRTPAPQLSSCFSQCSGVGVPCHHHQAPPWTFLGGLLEAVGSVPSSLSWQLHLNPMPAAWLDFGAKLWMVWGGNPGEEGGNVCLIPDVV